MKQLLALALAVTLLLSGAALGEMVSDIQDVTTDGLSATSLLTGMPTPELPLVDEPMTITVMYPR